MNGAIVRRASHFEPPIELRFVDFFMIIVTALMFVAVMLSVLSAFIGGGEQTAPRVTAAALPTALLGQPFRMTLAAEGGSTPYQWRVKGALPEGLTLLPSGLIDGVARKIERKELTLEVRDARGRAATTELAMEVLPVAQGYQVPPPQLSVITAAVALPDAVQGSPYSFRLRAAGGVPPYRWRISRGALPAGLSLTAAGDVVGVPEKGMTRSAFAVTAADAKGLTHSVQGRMAVNAAPPSLLWRALRLLTSVLAWFAYLLLALCVFYYVFVDQPPVVVENISLFTRLKNRTQQ